MQLRATRMMALRAGTTGLDVKFINIPLRKSE
jgi:hypothetical protein